MQPPQQHLGSSKRCTQIFTRKNLEHWDLNPALLGEKHQCYHYAIQPPTSYIEGQKIQQKIKKKFSPCSFFFFFSRSDSESSHRWVSLGTERKRSERLFPTCYVATYAWDAWEREREREREREGAAWFSWLGQPTAGDCLEEFSLDAKKQFLLEKNRLVRTCGESLWDF